MSKKTKEKPIKNKSRKKEKVKNDKNNIKTKDEKISFDQEIVIGLRRIDEPPEVKNKKLKKKKNSSKKMSEKNSKKRNSKDKVIEEPQVIIKSKYMQNYENDKKDNNSSTKDKQKGKKTKEKPKRFTQKQQISKKRRKIIFKIIKWLIFIGIVIAGIAYAMLSPIFNISEINVVGNSKISSETIISLSNLEKGQNIFNFRTSNIVDNIKENAYIDTVSIKRKLPDEIEIVVTERKATYMLTLGNGYVYINNQGYILEITSTKGDFPLIVGYETPEEQIQAGNRLSTEDLEKLNDVLKIVETASSMESEVADLITQIDISDESNYILTLEEENKEIYLGNATNLSTKILWINEFLEAEEGVEGVIYLNVDLNSENPYFRETI